MRRIANKAVRATSTCRCTVTMRARGQSAGKTSESNQNYMKHVPSDIGNYIAGFTDGEGSFNVSLKKRLDFRQQWKLSASFNISQKDRVILAWIKHILGCGTLRSRKDGVVYYEVTNIIALYTVILPFFRKFGFRSAYKKHNFKIFSEIVSHMYDGRHNTPEGFQEILKLREKLNPGIGRKRKYTLYDVVHSEESSETARKIDLSHTDADATESNDTVRSLQ